MKEEINFKDVSFQTDRYVEKHKKICRAKSSFNGFEHQQSLSRVSYPKVRKHREYYLNNAKLRACMRIKEKRPLTFDLIIKNPLIADKVGIDPYPFSITLIGLFDHKVSDFFHDFALLSNSTEKNHIILKEFLCYSHIIFKTELEKRENKVSKDFPLQIRKQLCALFGTKVFEQLIQLEQDINYQLTLGFPDKYWGSVMDKLFIQKAKAQILRIHQDLFMRHLEKFNCRPMSHQDNCALLVNDCLKATPCYNRYRTDPINLHESIEESEDGKYLEPQTNTIKRSDIIKCCQNIPHLRSLRFQTALATVNRLQNTQTTLTQSSKIFLSKTNDILLPVDVHPTFLPISVGYT
jgi:hypothetical protein